MNKKKIIQIMQAGILPAKKVCLPIRGYSMYPLLHPGSQVIISTQVNPERILIGDIVVIVTRQHSSVTFPCITSLDIMAHRVIFIRKRKKKPVLFLTKGDMNRAFDKAVYMDQIVGKITGIQKENRLILISQLSWRIAGFLIAVSSGIFGLLHQWIDRCLISSGKKKSMIGFWFHRFSFFAHRIFLYTIILSLQ